MTAARTLTMILVAAVCTFATRVAPFLLFNGKKPIPPIVRYLGEALPPAVIALLVSTASKTSTGLLRRMVHPSCCVLP